MSNLFRQEKKQPFMYSAIETRRSKSSYSGWIIGGVLLRVSPAEAQEMAVNGVDLRVSKTTTTQGIVGNLYYYGFIDSEARLYKLLELTKDTTPGQEDSIKVGSNTIDINSHYYLNYQMTDEEIADALLNKAKFASDFTAYNYLFMPSGRGGPSERPEK